jgi:diaminopimelate epimerase
MRFVKMHGLGNDYVFVDCRAQTVDLPAVLARKVSDRPTGIGSDGLILIRPLDGSDVGKPPAQDHTAKPAAQNRTAKPTAPPAEPVAYMEMYNADGSRAQMCGNGLRCVAKYVYECGWADRTDFVIATDAGPRAVWCTTGGDGRVAAVRVDMGVPGFEPSMLPARIDGPRIINYPLEIAGAVVPVTCVSMGNPHAVHFVERMEALDLMELGPQVEHAEEFPARINFHLVRVDARDRLMVRTWERGSGITRACGTGACASLVAGVLTDRCSREATVTLPGGDLHVAWSADEHVYMTGPAEIAFTGEWCGEGG